MSLTMAAAEWGGEFEGVLDPINSLFDFAPLPAFEDLRLFGVDLWINRTILIAWMMTLITMGLLVVATRYPKVVPGKGQSRVELLCEVIRGIATDIIGRKGER